jgi:hypothetical protein
MKVPKSTKVTMSNGLVSGIHLKSKWICMPAGRTQVMECVGSWWDSNDSEAVIQAWSRRLFFYCWILHLCKAKLPAKLLHVRNLKDIWDKSRRCWTSFPDVDHHHDWCQAGKEEESLKIVDQIWNRHWLNKTLYATHTSDSSWRTWIQHKLIGHSSINAIDTHHNKARANSSSMQLFVQQTPPFRDQGTSSASIFSSCYCLAQMDIYITCLCFSPFSHKQEDMRPPKQCQHFLVSSVSYVKFLLHKSGFCSISLHYVVNAG